MIELPVRGEANWEVPLLTAIADAVNRLTEQVWAMNLPPGSDDILPSRPSA